MHHQHVWADPGRDRPTHVLGGFGSADEAPHQGAAHDDALHLS